MSPHIHVDLLITHAYLYIDRNTELADGWLAVVDGRVHSFGPTGSAEPSADRKINAAGCLVTPGLVNAHHHMYQNLTRSFAPAVNGTLFEWLTTLYPIWSKLEPEAVHASTYVAMAELLLGGCTTSMDHMYVHPRPELIDAQIQAATQLGFRFLATRGSMTRSTVDGGLPPKSVVQDKDTILADSVRLIEKYHDPNPGALTRVALAPCSPFSVTEELMRESAELAEAYDVRLHSHLAEDMDEHAYCLQTYGCTPVEYLERTGWAGSRTWVAHFIYPSSSEQLRLAAAGVSAVQCPSSNMMIGGGSADASLLRGIGMPVGLGCDGSASTDHGSMWLESRTALLLGRFRNGPASMTARDVLDMATRGSATCLGWDDEIGHLRVGACADLVVWEAEPLALAGALTDPVEAWLRCGPARAGTTVVAGKVLVDGGQLCDSAVAGVLRTHDTHARRMQSLL